MHSTDLVAFFKDGSSSPIELSGGLVRYVDGLPVEFQTGIATRGDGKRRVLFLMDGQEQQADPWIGSIGRRPGLAAVS